MTKLTRPVVPHLDTYFVEIPDLYNSFMKLSSVLELPRFYRSPDCLSCRRTSRRTILNILSRHARKSGSS